MRLYNTLTRSKEVFAPIDSRDVRMYVCGPTVYDFAHIGNARPVIVFDVLFRLLRHLYGEKNVTYVRNITDVDDKINARAARDFPGLPLNEAIRRVTEKTTSQFHEDVAALGCLKPTHEPRATEFVEPRQDGKTDMVTLIQKLIERGHAYEAQGEVLFDTASMTDYGRLSKRNLDEQQAGARVAVEAHKKHPADFVLWKQSSEDEPGWESPWGQEAWTAAGRTGKPKGRPGWHIECSAMAEAYLGQVFDIHGGGLDLIFPHHENEIAQSRCAHGTDVMANVWMHNGFLQVEGQKMSKSLGNFVTINELLTTEKFGGRKWPGEVLRLAMLMTHYREPIDFSVRKLEEALSIWTRWGRALAEPTSIPSVVPSEIVDALSTDLNTPQVSRLLSRYDSAAFRSGLRGDETLDEIEMRREIGASQLAGSLAFLGISVSGAVGERVNRITQQMIDTRLAVIAQKNWIEADRIRDELLAEGIQLKDGKDPVTGERVTTWEVKR